MCALILWAEKGLRRYELAIISWRSQWLTLQRNENKLYTTFFQKYANFMSEKLHLALELAYSHNRLKMLMG